METYSEFYHSIVKLVDNVENARCDKLVTSGQVVVRKYFPLSITASRPVDVAAATIAVKAGSLSTDQVLSGAEMEALETELSDLASAVLTAMKIDLDSENRGWVYPLSGWVRHPVLSSRRLNVRRRDRWEGFVAALRLEAEARPVVEEPKKDDVARVTHVPGAQTS
ncbi:hypothetical protein ACFWY9_37390 [Amycolatopsis sp. NPDC059027]|uniref:hypothetical protein n=1 Tax=Amycolatopsis sp. NPDC059027 TaxID=3346709 RepID=UPI00366E977E